jgi:hypothetical protein
VTTITHPAVIVLAELPVQIVQGGPHRITDFLTSPDMRSQRLEGAELQGPATHTDYRTRDGRTSVRCSVVLGAAWVTVVPLNAWGQPSRYTESFRSQSPMSGRAHAARLAWAR